MTTKSRNKIVLATGMLLAAQSIFGAQSSPDIRIYTIDGGHGVIHKIELFEDKDHTTATELKTATPCFLIKDGSKWLLWDTGISDSIVGKPLDLGAFYFTKNATTTEQLKTIGVTPNKVNYLAFSHFHFDHTGNANLFTHSTWLVQSKELEYAQSKPTPFGIDLKNIEAFSKVKHKMLNGDYDVFGDGKVKIISTPGHTPGHASLLVTLTDSGPVLLSGDLFHTRQNFETSWVPSINNSAPDTKDSIARVHEILDRLHARLIIQHDPTDFAALPKLPGYLH